MKRCPECRRDYYDDTLSYCLEDGTSLVHGVSGERQFEGESATAIFPAAAPGAQGASTPPTHETVKMPEPSAGSANTSSAKRRIVLMILGVVLLAGAGFGLYRWVSTPAALPTSFQNPTITRLTTNGRSTSAAISPDGKYVIYGADEGAKDSLWLKQVATSSNIQIFPAEEDVFYWGLTFTPDSNYVNFIRAEFEKNKAWGLSQMAIIGGAQKGLMSGIEGPISYSPDGKQFAFVRDEFPTGKQSSLMVANADGTGERLLASRTAPETFPARQTGPAWSPDGKTIACIIADETLPLHKMDVMEISVDDGTVKPVITQEWKYINQVAWLHDKSSLMVTGSDRASSSYSGQIWSFSYPEGGARRITTDFLDYRSLSLNTDSSLLVTVQSSSIANIWSAGADINRPVQIRSGGNNGEGMGGLSLTSDGRVLFTSRASGDDEIWIMNTDGGFPKQLTDGMGSNFEPGASADGQYVVFTSLRDSRTNIWRMKTDGSASEQVTSGNGDYGPEISPDSRWLVYTSETAGNSYLWKVPIEGGEAVRLSDNFAHSPRISPDGKWIVCSWRKDQDSTWRYAVLPFEGGQPVKVFDLTGKKGAFRWSRDSKALYYLRDTQGGVTNIWSLPFPEGAARQVTDFKGETIFDFVWSNDGKQLVMSKGTTTRDVVMLKGF